MRRHALSLTTALMLGACASVGPDYAAPSAPQGAEAPFALADAALFGAAEPPAGWWRRLYRSPALDALIGEALANNRDLAEAEANLAQVRAVLAEARAGRIPATGVSASAAAARQQNPATGGMASVETVTAGLDVSYEVDVFGRRARSIERAEAEVEASAAAMDVVRVSVAAETARAFADACASNLQIAVAERSLALLDESVSLTRRQLDAGRGTGLDVARAESLSEVQRAAIPPLRAARDAALLRLAVLTGRTPAQIPQAAAACAAPPSLAGDGPIPVGDGASLLRRRPDVRMAERRLAAATANIGVASADLYPSVSLGGSLSTTGGAGAAFGDEVQFSLGPLIRWSFPNRAAARARIDQAGAAATAAAARFDQTVLEALREAETALSAYARQLDRHAALAAAREQGARAASLARLRFEGGLDSYLSVLDAERTLADLEGQVAASEGALASRQIELFKALGGGWAAGD